MTSRGKPLENVTVVELGHSVAAPYAGLIFADLGARVVKIENPDGGDYARGWGPPFWKDTASAFLCLNRGKESAAVDFASEKDVARLRSFIVAEADVVIQNLRPGILDRFDLTCERLRSEKPSLIWCDIGAFGANGPLSHKPGYDPLAQASTGIMSVTGERDRPPVRVGVSLVDMGAGMWTVIGALAALIERKLSGEGQRVSTSLYETGLGFMTVPLAGFAASGEVRLPFGSGVAEIVPYQAFETSDSWIMIAAGNDNLFRKLTTALALVAEAQNPDYAVNAGRVVNRDRLLPVIADAVRRHSAHELGLLLDAAGVPNAPLLTVDQVAVHPQTLALGMLGRCGDEEIDLVGLPITLDGARPRSKTAAPGLGQHSTALSLGDARNHSAE
jgi:crotonobetainyl-CoA:carnitine CoA-transferase CaiB-like acyl-CoA transferase